MMMNQASTRRGRTSRSCDNRGTTAKRFGRRLLVGLAMALWLCGCSRGAGEPPLGLGEGGVGSQARKTKLVSREGSPAGLRPGNDFLMYEVDYPFHGLTSIATVGLKFGSLREEIFPGKWRVVCDYKGMWDGRKWSEARAIPLSISIYGYSGRGEEYGRHINTYRLSKIVSGNPVYTDLSGKEKTIPASYFQVAPELP